MASVLDDLELTELACSIPGLSPVGAAAILAETGDLRRFTSSRAVVKHAGLAPRERKSGTFAGRARLTGAGRPHLRTAAWRAVWGVVQNNPVYAARYRHLTTRETNKLKRPKPKPSLLPRSCASFTPSSPPAKPGTRTSPLMAPATANDAHRGSRLTTLIARRVARPQAGSRRAFRGIENP